MVLWDNEYACIEIHREAEYISIFWKKYTPSAAYREVVSTLYELRKLHSTANLLSDNRNLPTISEADGYWTVDLARHYFPLIAYSRLAVVLSENSFAHLAVKSMQDELRTAYKEYREKSVSKYFSSPEEARMWIEKKEEL